MECWRTRNTSSSSSSRTSRTKGRAPRKYVAHAAAEKSTLESRCKSRRLWYGGTVCEQLVGLRTQTKSKTLRR